MDGESHSSAVELAFTGDQLKEVYQESEKKAREQLLSSSAELSTLTDLERKAAEFQRRAKEQEAKLNAIFSDWSGIPARAAAYRNRLDAIAAHRASLSPELQLQFEQALEGLISGDTRYVAVCDMLASRFYSRDLRLRLLDGFQNEAEQELQKLERRNADLSKTLGRPKHKLS
jgi:hypothetical protein